MLHARMQCCFMQPRLPGIIKSSARPARAVEKEPLQVRIPAIVKRRFKAHAALRGLEPNELFVEVWNHYKTNVIDVASKQEIEK